MKTFFIWFICLSILNEAGRVGWLGFGEYPRKTTKGLDAVNLIANLFFLGWALYLLQYVW